ncbi:GntR family transcriptional regulator [Streptomyces sp. CSDS2]|uniref:GntR family transcriptional regulator n=1 Tax=Streptomyces sp. CSDS2 TaxID=3055051 RepID=UPI0025AFC0C4|nr:GntR family transcriptional regulator [Streptomyces sp. CSDS2]MDN3260910.1 GntR family transcriptional regulator [Streptomyces sp. CSDS2]
MSITRVVAPVRAQVVEVVRAEILGGALAPGQRLVEREWCERLGVSRNTLREACRQLEAEGFLDIPPHKGPMVAVLSDEDARGIYEIREALESLAVRLFVERAAEAAVERLRAAVDELLAAHASGDVTAMLAAKGPFYDVLYEGAANRVLREQATVLGGRLARLRARSLSRPGRPRASAEEIEAVMRAVEARDAGTAAALWAAHVRAAARSAWDGPAEPAGSAFP